MIAITTTRTPDVSSGDFEVEDLTSTTPELPIQTTRSPQLARVAEISRKAAPGDEIFDAFQNAIGFLSKFVNLPELDADAVI